MEPEFEVLYNIGNARIREFPYPHLYVPEVFPEAFYRELLANLPQQAAMKNLRELGRTERDYPDRSVLPLTAEHMEPLPEAARTFWQDLSKWLLGPRFGDLMVTKFAPYLQHRFHDLRNTRFTSEALVVRDRTNYSLGPHTDAPQKVLSFLFYLPGDALRPHLGTSIYLPRDPKLTCPGGPHYPFEMFHRMATMRYAPNALFAFMKTPKAFHGVERLDQPDVRRDLLLYDIRSAA